MADITDPEVIRFNNEYIRPACELGRAFKAAVNDLHARWIADGENGSIASRCPGTADLIADGRENEGVSRMTGYSLGAAHDNLKAGADTLNLDIIELPCVRPLAAN